MTMPDAHADDAPAGPRAAAWKAVDKALEEGKPKTAIESLRGVEQAAVADKAWAEAARAIATRILCETGDRPGDDPERLILLAGAMEKAPPETRGVLEAIRATPDYVPKVIFASSIAVFGAPFPAKIPDDFFTTPRTSYGTQKAITELLISDYARRGFIDGLSIRLPTICVRPGLPNKAASGFFSNIIREPLAGKPAILPVSDTVRHWFASPGSAVGFFRHALTLDLTRLGDRRALSMPGLSATVAEEIEALRRVAGQKAVDLITSQPDDTIAKIVATWPSDFDTARAKALGFVAETSFDEIIAAHLKDI